MNNMGKMAGLNFDVFLDDHGMKRSMQELKSTAAMLKSEMRANFAELRSGGQVTDAYAGKVKDSERAIKAQNNIIADARKAQKGLNLQTEEGRTEFAKQEKIITSAKKSITSLTGEQKRAKNSLEYYKSGMADMNKTMKMASSASETYVSRLRAEGKENEANREQLTGLRNKYSALSDIYKKQKTELDKIANSSGKTSKAYLKQKTRLDQTGKAMAETRMKTKSLNKSTGGLSKTMARVADKGALLSKSLNNVGKKAIEFGRTSSTVSLAVGSGFVYGSKKAIELQNSFKQTTNLIKNGGETQKAAISGVNKMQNDAAADAVKYGKSQKSIADGYQALVKRGYSSKQALGAMRSELQASVASGDDFKDVVSVSSQTLEAFGLRTKSTAGMIRNTKKVTNQLAYAADLTSTGFSDLGVGMSYVGSTAHQAGFSLSETAAAMGLLSNNGLEADKAGTGLRKAINSLISPTKNGTSALKAMNLSTKDFIDKKGNMKSMTDIFGLLKSHTEGMSKNEKTNLFHSLFGTTGQQAGLILAQNADQLGKLNDQVARSDKQHNGKGYVATLASQNMKTAQNQLAKFKQAGEAVSIMFAKNVLPYITKIAVKLAGILDGIGKMSPKVKKLTVGFGLVLAAISPVSFAIGGISKGIGASISGLKTMVNWYGKLNKKMAAPVTSRAVSNGKGISNKWNSLNTGGKLATGAAGAGVATSAGLDIYGAFKAKNPDKKFKDAGKGIGTAIGGGIGLFFGGPLGAALGATIGKVIGGWGGKAAKQFTDGWNKKGKNVKPPKGLLPKAGYYARSGADAIASWTKSFTKAFGKTIKSISSFNKSVGKAFGKVVGIIKSVLKPIANVLKIALVAPTALVVGLTIKAWQKIKKPFKAVLNYIYKAIKSAWKGIKSLTKSTWDAVKKYVIHPVKKVWNAINKYIVKKIVKGIKNAWKDVKSVTRSAWNLFKKYVVHPIKAVWDAVSKYIVKKIVKSIKNAWKGIKSHTKAAWKLIKKYAVDPIVSVYKKASSIMRKLKKVISSSMSSIKRTWHSAWKKVGDFFGDIWKSIKRHARNGINGVISIINAGINGIDAVIHAFGSKKKHAIKRIGKVHFATGTGSLSSGFRKSINQITPAVVNDEPGAKNPELIFRKATGNVEYLKGNNANTLLMPGDEVANAHDSAVLAPKLGISHFAKGGIGSFFSGIGSAISNTVSGVASTVKKDASWLKKLFKTAVKIIKHPIKSVESLFKYSKGTTKGVFRQLSKGAFGKVESFAKSWWSKLWSMVNPNKGKSSKTSAKGIKGQVGSGFWKTISKLADKFGVNTGETPTGSHKHWMKQAGIPKSWYNAMNTIISAESGWNVHAQNPTSSAYGIPQALPGSKMASAGKDWRDNAITQLKWMKGYVKGRYGNASNALKFRKSHNWYANGGFSNVAKLANISEGNTLESIIPLSKPSRAWELIGKSAAYLDKKNNSHTTSANTSEDNSAYLQKLITQNSQLINQIGQFMQLVQAKPMGITSQQIYNVNKRQAAIQTNKYNRSLGLR